MRERACGWLLALALSLVVSGTTFSEERRLGSHEGMELTLVSSANTDDSSSIKFTIPKNSSPQIFKLENPDRLVMDIPGLKLRNNKTLTLAANEPLKAVRIGVHPDRVRVVFDLKAGQIPEYTVSPDGRRVSLTFGKSPSDASAMMASLNQNSSKAKNSGQNVNSVISSALQNLPKETVVAKKTIPVPVPAKIEQPSKKSDSSVSNTDPEEVFPLSPSSPAKIHASEGADEHSVKGRLADKTLVESPDMPKVSAPVAAALNPSSLQSPLSGGLKVSAIGFERDKNSQIPMIKISMTQRTPYTLTRTGQRAYRLTIPGATFAEEHLTLPQFPPQDFKGVTLVNPEKGNGQVEFFIGVDRDTKLASFSNDNEIWIKIDMSNK